MDAVRGIRNADLPRNGNVVVPDALVTRMVVCFRNGCGNESTNNFERKGVCMCDSCLREMKIKYVMMRENDPEEFFEWFITTRKGNDKPTQTDIEIAMVERHAAR